MSQHLTVVPLTADEGLLSWLREEDSYSFRIGPLHGPWHVAHEVSARCGPQVLIQPDAMTAIVQQPGTSYEEVHLALFGVPAPADGSDRGWHR